ncbi:MAG: aquaporin Z [Deltaproteobacteria bacterium]|jgi:aquaporin Z|nr:aquaporin Z [Deltaproteobacteria bacterium]
MQKLIAEFLGTLWLVLGGCGAAVIAGADIGYAGISLAFGLSVMTMIYAVGGISGGHFNPAVTLGLTAAGKFKKNEALPYIAAQLLGAIVAAGIIYIVKQPYPDDLATVGAFATNFYEQGNILPALTIEIVLTFFFLIVILGSTSSRVPAGFAPIAIGLTLTLIHLISIPVTNTSVNPARSSSQAIWVYLFNTDSIALCQLWLFWVAPIIGAVTAGRLYKKFLDR